MSHFFFQIKTYLVKNEKVLAGLLLFILLLIPRVVGATSYDVFEDELLAIDYNLINSSQDLFFNAPDTTHPGLWYSLFDFVVSKYGYSVLISNYRYLQILTFISLVMISYWYSLKVIDRNIRLFFFGLLATNAYLTHLTFQFRMYGLTLGFAILFCLWWYKQIQNNSSATIQGFVFISVLGVLGFFSSYSFIWLLFLWPIVYLLRFGIRKSFRFLCIYGVGLAVGTLWFLPRFVQNAQLSIAANQWGPELSISGFSMLFGNFFGVLPEEVNSMHTVYVSVICTVILISVCLSLFKKKDQVLISMIFGFISTFLIYLSFVLYGGKSIFYSRVSIPLVFVLFLIFGQALKQLESRKIIRIVLFMVFTIQLSQLGVYHYQNVVKTDNYTWDFRVNPMRIVENIPYNQNNCVVTAPFWNDDPLSYFLHSNVVIIHFNSLITSEELLRQTSSCAQIYLLDQTTVENMAKEDVYSVLTFTSKEEVSARENQKLFKLIR